MSLPVYMKRTDYGNIHHNDLDKFLSLPQKELMVLSDFKTNTDIYHDYWSIPLHKGCYKKDKLWLEILMDKQRRIDIRDNSIVGLQLACQGIDEIPQSISCLSNLESLFIVDNDLKGGLPSSLFNLSKLKILYVTSAGLREISADLGRLTNLEELYLHHNELTSLPWEIQNLEKLKGLYVFGNQISELPEEIGYLTNLRNLRLAGNPLKKLPKTMELLTNLRYLDINNCEFRSIPRVVKKLRLNRFDSYDNPRPKKNY